MSALLLVVSASGLLLLGLLALLAATRAAGRHPRRGGYIRLSASRTPSRAMIRTPQEAAVMGYFSSSLPPGGVSEGWAFPRWQRDPSRLTGRGWSTLGTADPGANGLQRPDAA